MNQIPLISGYHLEGLKLHTKQELIQEISLVQIQTLVLDFLDVAIQSLTKLWKTQSFADLTTQEVSAVAIVAGAVALLQVYLALT